MANAMERQNVPEIQEVLSHWFTELPLKLSPLNGRSPNLGWLVEYANNRFVLKKCVRNHDHEWLHYLEDLTDALIRHRFPIQPMVLSKHHKRTVLQKGAFWQLRPFSEGRFYEMGNQADEQEAIRVLKELHSLKDLPKGPKNPNCELKNWISQPEKTLEHTASALKMCVSSQKAVSLLREYEKQLEDVLLCLTPSLYDSLPHAVTHGDFHAGNLLMRNNRLCMVLDFDTAGYRPRIYDVAISAYLLTRVKRGTFCLDLPRTVRFLSDYSQGFSVTENEWHSISAFIKLLYLPTGRYLTLMHTHVPHLLSWYIEWSFHALQSAAHQLKDGWYHKKGMTT
ncbi:phosphotransferase enzyme family protein [Bacillus sp. NPDC077027]|uniref:phosphotransferase enzyme family protein n=1 Tax=Bacillus sp. NPDC077027 TaxID=3390548 RepID=UPI003CFDCB5D